MNNILFRMKKIQFLTLMALSFVIIGLLSSCKNDDKLYYETGNPLPGSWYAQNVDYEGYPVDFTAEIADNFNEGSENSGVYCSEGDDCGNVVATYEGEIYEQATIKSVIYNSKTHTGRFTLHYSDDPEDTLYQMDFYYEPKRDKFTAINLNFNVTFTRK